MLTGQSFTASQGTAVAPNDTVQPSGLSITSEQGTAIGSSSQEADLTGQSATCKFRNSNSTKRYSFNFWCISFI